jgi:hypothetical protein
MGQSHEIFATDFFQESSSPKPLKQNCREFSSQGVPSPVSTTLAANLLLVSTAPVANNWNNISLLTPESKLEEKTTSIC